MRNNEPSFVVLVVVVFAKGYDDDYIVLSRGLSVKGKRS